MMHHTSIRLLVATAILLGLLQQPAHGQSDSDLRRENQRLNTQLQETSRDLEAARSRIAELEQQVNRLERALAAMRGDTPAPTEPAEEKTTIDESEPSASPRALFGALQRDYQETLESMEIGREGDRTRANYMRALNRWRASVIRKYRAQIQWHVRVVRETPTRNGYDLNLEAIDPVTHVKLGEPFDISLPRGLARRYESLRDVENVSVLVLRGTLVPQVNVNPERQIAGPFDNPRLIGPFAEFRFTIEPRSLLAAEDEDADSNERR